MYGIGYGGNKYRPRGLFGGGGNAGASTAQVPIVQGTPRTRDQAQAMGLIGGSAPRSRGYFDELLADPFTTLFLGTNGLDRKYASQQAEQEAARMAPQRAWMENYVSGLPDNQRFAAMTNPEEYSKNTAQGFAPQTSTFYDPTSGKWNQKPQDMITVGNDATVFDPNTRAPVFSNRAPQGPKLFNTGQAVVSVTPDNKAQVLYRDPQNTGGTGSFITLSPEQVAARGYAPGTVVQMDGRGREYVNARPSTAQTGQPTEGERGAGLHASISLNGLQKIMSMEGGGYNRAGVGEQLGGLVGGENERLYDQGADEFIDGYLRAMTGAAATRSEIDNYKRQWFPQWGDTEAVIQQKAQGRLNALKAMKTKAGRSWNPAWDGVISNLESKFGVQSSFSSRSMPLATDNGQETVPGIGWNQPQMNYQTPQQDQPPMGISPEEWQFMSPEDRALFQ